MEIDQFINLEIISADLLHVKSVEGALNPPRGKPRGIFTVRIKNRFSVRSHSPPQAAGNALAIAVQILTLLSIPADRVKLQEYNMNGNE